LHGRGTPAVSTSFSELYLQDCASEDLTTWTLSFNYVITYKNTIVTVFIVHLQHSESPTGLKVFTGNANKPLAQDIANHLGMNLGKITVARFADGEVNVVINENVRGKDVYIIQPTSPPVNETLMELLLMISTMRRASARKITAVIPYYGYARQDRKVQMMFLHSPQHLIALVPL
jgi:N-terminal domain of ribose phosphate pyrophosphokinase